MKESISINNFLVIKKAELEIKKINVIIGPQANGKSVIAKLIYFFKSTSHDFLNGIRSNKPKRALDLDILNDFEKRFPRYSWEGDNFQIIYNLNNLQMKIIGKKNSSLNIQKVYRHYIILKKSFTKKNLKKPKIQRKNKEAVQVSSFMFFMKMSMIH